MLFWTAFGFLGFTIQAVYDMSQFNQFISMGVYLNLAMAIIETELGVVDESLWYL